jgi:hypothetical protein
LLYFWRSGLSLHRALRPPHLLALRASADQRDTVGIRRKDFIKAHRSHSIAVALLFTINWVTINARLMLILQEDGRWWS